MKKLLTILTLVLAYQSYATLWTINQNEKAGAQFTSLQAAIDSSSASDTLYIHGNNTSYGRITINKQLVLIGEGYTAQGIFQPATKLGAIVLDTTGTGTAMDGLVLIGLRITAIGNELYYNYENQASYSANATQVDNVIISRCYLSGHQYSYDRPKVLGDNWILMNCRISTLEVNGYDLTSIFNCYFVTKTNTDLQFIYGSTQGTRINNCVFQNTQVSGGEATFDNCSGMTIENSIFQGPYPTLTGTSQSEFKNCFFSDEGLLDSSAVVGDFNSVLDCWFGESVNDLYSTSSAYLINDTHASKTGGTDNKEIGLYGGSFPISDLRGTPNLPLIYGFQIENVVVEPEGKLKVTVKVKSQN